MAIEYIQSSSPEAAQRFVEALLQVGRSLSELSERGRVVPELDDPQVRELLLSRHRIIYEVFEDRVAVLRIIHASPDFLTAWSRTGPTD